MPLRAGQHREAPVALIDHQLYRQILLERFEIGAPR
jgi:hypothetical protein